VLTSSTLVLLMIGMLFLLGMLTFIAGILTLTFRAASNDVKSLAVQTGRLAQKGMAEEVVGLVSNTTDLVGAMDQLVRTTRGIGIFLTILGLVLMAGACWLAIEVYKMQL
jgi:hypothetical protein